MISVFFKEDFPGPPPPKTKDETPPHSFLLVVNPPSAGRAPSILEKYRFSEQRNAFRNILLADFTQKGGLEAFRLVPNSRPFDIAKAPKRSKGDSPLLSVKNIFETKAPKGRSKDAGALSGARNIWSEPTHRRRRR